ncbi:MULTISPECIES: hypothetical protein [Pasteurellaceae]|uniref:Uncharacterized protein n=1 Tax=Pasteurella atlantica TaxID=2827233 RepID=A0AAW8CH91_9PAST|nr:hypothetical protein [Pasteurella atlantica]MBR0574474.1 hypothetical protein [Pasteurella atlantica]MDP8039352.1 hypothetical protein [Pasteurella atlantica]MDP8041444.1 hypothetical protein [Pasteurella atlantica]MDP8043631.1 hypothetical protein [Pasteurella atlantica]MDP8045665.1 hypothetical protein [Pasteurella atlantica]
MQFALKPAFDSQFIFSAYEFQIEYHLGVDEKLICNDLNSLDFSDDCELTIVYGKFLCQPEHKENNLILEDILRNKNKGLFCIVDDSRLDKKEIEIGYFAYKDIKLYEREPLGYVPFSMLIYGEEKAINKIKKGRKTQSIEASFRYNEEDPIVLNFYNRLGVFAMKSVEKRIKQPLTIDNWLQFVDDERALRVAKSIY